MNKAFLFIMLLLTYQHLLPLHAADDQLIDFFDPQLPHPVAASDVHQDSPANQDRLDHPAGETVKKQQGALPATAVAPNLAREKVPHHEQKPLVVVEPQEQPAIATERKILIDQANASPLAQAAYLGAYLEPWRFGPEESLEFVFENADLSTLLAYMEEKFQLTFILDDNFKPLPAHGKSIMGNKISFKTHTPLSKKQAWNVFITLLDMAGVAAVPGTTERVYRLVPSKNPKDPFDATHEPLPLFIGVDISLIPDNDALVRYVYFVANTNIETIITAIDAVKSAAAPPAIRFADLNAVIITDRAMNIKTMLKVIQELDQINGQEGLAVIKLKRADATKAAKIYADFARQENAQGAAARILGPRRASTTEYFPRETRVIADPRTNSLIVLGTREAIETITEFIRTVIEQRDDRPETPRYVYKLKFLDAESMASILQEVLKFKEDSDAAKSGGVRDGDKFFKSISIVPEPSNNSLIISADYQDYMNVYELIKSIDIEQPQVALRLFLLNITVTDGKGFGVQMRNKKPGPNGLIGDNVAYQTSNLAEVQSGIVENSTGSGALRLLGNLVTLAAGAPIGSTVIQLGNDALGVWGLLNMLESYATVNVVSNPFMLTTNKYPAQFVSGEIRRVVDANIFTTSTQQALKDLPATLDIRITPQISKGGLLSLDIGFSLEQFLDANVDSNNGNRTSQKIETTVIVANNEVLALGGLASEQIIDTETSVPILGAIPGVGWLFKNRTQTVTRTSLLLLIQAEILKPVAQNPSTELLTRDAYYDSRELAAELREYDQPNDPVNRLFFRDNNPVCEKFIDNFMHSRNRYTMEAIEERKSKALELAEKDPAACVQSKKRGHGRKPPASRETSSPPQASVAEKTPDIIDLIDSEEKRDD